VDDRPTFNVVLAALPGWGVPAVLRLRRFLKAALRAYGLRCLKVVEVPAAPPRGRAGRTGGQGDRVTR
jgi:hypothetical protein